jgi:hypothetical protein
VDEKTTISDLNSHTFFEKKINAASYLNMPPGPGGMLSLTQGSYKFPFQFTLPNNIPASFEYPFRNRRASLRYTFTAELLSPYVKSVTESFIWIKARPINIPDQIKHENYVTVKNVGILSRGKSGIALFTMVNNYRINDMLPFTIDIYNEECGIQVKEVKISIKRIVTFVKEGKEYQKRTAILRKRYPCVCDKNSKKSFHYDDIQLRDNELKDVDYNRALNPYPFIDDLNLLMPNMRSKLIKCEYSLKATSYFDLSVLEKNRPRVEMPIYVTHQLQKEFDYEKNTNQYKGQGQEFANRDMQRGFEAHSTKNDYWNSNDSNNNNNNNSNNNNNFGSMNKSVGPSLSGTGGSKKFSYEAYIASKKFGNNNNNQNSNNDWKNKTTFQSSSNYGNFGNNNSFNNNSSMSNPFDNNNQNPWESRNPYNNKNNNPWENNSNNNNNPWGNNNNNNNNNPWGNNNNNNNNNPWGNNNNNNNFNQNKYGQGNNRSENPFGGGNNDFPSLDAINSSQNNSGPKNPFGDNNPPNPFGNNNPPNPFGNSNPPNSFGNNNNNNGNLSNPFGGNSGPSPYQSSYPGF